MKKNIKNAKFENVALMGGYIGVIGAVMMWFPQLGILPGIVISIGIYTMLMSLLIGFLSLRPRLR